MGMLVQTSLKTQILEAQGESLKAVNFKNETLHHLEKEFETRSDGVRYFKDNVWVAKVDTCGQQFWTKHTSQGINSPRNR